MAFCGSNAATSVARLSAYVSVSFPYTHGRFAFLNSFLLSITGQPISTDLPCHSFCFWRLIFCLSIFIELISCVISLSFLCKSGRVELLGRLSNGDAT